MSGICPLIANPFSFCPDPFCTVHGEKTMTQMSSPTTAPNPDAPKGTEWFCDTARDIIGGDGQRRKDYGSVEESFARIAVLWSAVLGVEVTSEQVALCMIQVKLARLFQTPNHTDSWVDIIGYAALGGQVSQQSGRYM